MSSWPHSFATQYPSVALSWLDDQFNQINAASTSTVSLAGAALVGFKQLGAGSVATTAQTELQRIIYVDQFGAKGDGTTDDATAIQAAVTSIPAYGSQQNAFSLQPSNVLKFTPGKTYLIGSQISATFRNYFTLDFTGAVLKWGGANAGRMWDFMGCNYLRVVGDLVDGNAALSVFFRVSGGNTAGVSGKNNATGLRAKTFVIQNMYASGTDPFIQTTNDTPVYGDYSLDDSEFDGVKWNSVGYACIELASSEIKFKGGCNMVSATRGILYRTGATSNLEGVTFSGVRYPHYVVADAAVGRIENHGCYAENMNSVGPVEGSFLFCENTGTTTAVKEFNMIGGLYTQSGNTAYVTTSSKFLDCGNARIVAYLVGPRWQDAKQGTIDMGTNGVAMISKGTLDSSYADYMPPLSGNIVYQRIERDASFFIATPSVSDSTFTVNSASANDPAARTFSSLDNALAVMDQLGATRIIVDMQTSDAVTVSRYLAGDLRITTTVTASVTFNASIQMRSGSRFTMDAVNAVCTTASWCVLNQGGTFFANNLKVSSGSGKYLVRHENGQSLCGTFTLQSGRLVDASYIYGCGLVQITGSNTYTSAETAVVISGSQIECRISSASAPASGTWDVGMLAVTPTPTASGNIGFVCTTAGTPGTWKSYASIAA